MIVGIIDILIDVIFYLIFLEEDINFILNEVCNYLSCDVEVRRGDVLVVWSGICFFVIDFKFVDIQFIF